MAVRNYIIPLFAFVCVIALLINGPIPQKNSYHSFADKRTIYSIPNFLNVITNLPFVIVGLIGIRNVKKNEEQKLRYISLTIFIAFLLLPIGSGYYHLYPNNVTLVFDRIPITIITMSFFSYIMYRQVRPKSGHTAFYAFNFVGILTVIYWAITEASGKGDLRWYGMVQFFPTIAIPLLLFLNKASFNVWRKIASILVLFGTAKITENYDPEIYTYLKSTFSGHSFKHLFMAAAGYKIVELVTSRTIFS